jgi:hypothetical protein
MTNLALVFQSPFIPSTLSSPEKSINLAPSLNFPVLQLYQAKLDILYLPVIFDLTHPTS